MKFHTVAGESYLKDTRQGFEVKYIFLPNSFKKERQ